MKILVVTEKFDPETSQRDGGAQLVNTLKRVFGNTLYIMQFGETNNPSAHWNFIYPYDLSNRFEKRLANAGFIAEKIKAVEHDFTHICFIHISMQFGLVSCRLSSKIKIVTFPMFLSPSYQISGEVVPLDYIAAEKEALKLSECVLTPSHLEKKQLVNHYQLDQKKIKVIPRGINECYIAQKNKDFHGHLNFCSIGSIKPQKNTLELVHLFSKIHAKYENSNLNIIGPIQNQIYYNEVKDLINYLKLHQAIKFEGYVAPLEIQKLINSSHFHLSTSLCETFGRSIFETLAAGIPNIARAQNNAAADFLSHLPYIRFVKNNDEALKVIDEFIPNLSELSNLATEIGTLYSDNFLSRLLVAEVQGQNAIAISDYDGTLYHKNSITKTQESINFFRQFPIRILCSARGLDDLLAQLKLYHLNVDWIIAWGGAVVSDGQGKILWKIPLTNHQLSHLENQLSEVQDKAYIQFENSVLQIAVPADKARSILGFRTEIYSNKAFIAHWQASKLHAIHRLLNYINYSGRVSVFGDGQYDLEMLTYFDGSHITQ